MSARPGEWPDSDWPSLAQLLDAGEAERARRFQHQGDERAYVLSHALRRMLLGAALRTAPGGLRIEHDGKGRPVLAFPHPAPAGPIFFSHARRRELVACALTSAAPVGIDVETMRASAADIEPTLARLVRLPDAGSASHLPAAQLCTYWTALEAYWKALGLGLRDENPRLVCERQVGGALAIRHEGDSADIPPRAFASRVANIEGGCVTVATCSTKPVALRHFHCSSAMEIKQLCNENASPEEIGRA